MNEQPVLMRLHDNGRDLLVVRRTSDGMAGEVVISTPTVTMTIRVPEILPAFSKIQAHKEAQPWTRTEVV